VGDEREQDHETRREQARALEEIRRLFARYRRLARERVSTTGR
jgi:hypothetical protein